MKQKIMLYHIKAEKLYNRITNIIIGFNNYIMLLY